MLELNKSSFKETVLESEDLVLVNFWGPTCAPCKQLVEPLENLEGEYRGDIHFTSIDITGARSIAKKENITSLPIVAIYHSGEMIDYVSGEEANDNSIEEMILRNIKD